ncbi:MAG TPA: rRNA maturation RNase YbeY [Vicinamibacterales bacterium]|nr:rRNA maturation RNase YbeY [Vicinamibacterales bacterium]
MPLAVTLTDGRGRPLRVVGLAAWLRRVAPANARGAVTIALVSDAHMRRLNRRYRGKDYATDVLSFASTPEPVARAVRRSRVVGRQPVPNLGDVVVARGVARRQAREHGHAVAVELKVLALHGLLHLLGYDHERDDGEMRRVEQRLRRKGGLREGLIERA